MKPVTAIIPCWNAVEYTERCFSHLLACKSSLHQVIFIDNGSTDRTRDVFAAWKKEHGDWIQIVTNKENLGFGAAIMQGVAITDPDDDLLFLNNDVEIIDPKAVHKLQDVCYSFNDCAAVHPRQVFPDGEKLACGPSFTLPYSRYGYSWGNEPDVRQYIDNKPSDIVMMACLYIRRKAWNEHPCLDPELFAYSEDSDWCIEIKKRGWKVYYAGTVDVVHHVNVTSSVNGKNAIKDYQEKSVEHFKAKHEGYFRDRYAGTLMVRGTTGFSTGYARLTTEIMYHLEHDEPPIKVHYGWLYGLKPQEPLSPNHYVNEQRLRDEHGRGIQIVAGQGDMFYANSGDYRLGLSMMDCERWPRQWVNQANENLHLLYVPTKQGAEDAAASGITVPIKVCPLGVDPDYYHPGAKPLHTYRHMDYRRSINFLSVFEWGERKMPGLLMRAWHRAFGHRDDIALFIKTSNQDPSVNIAQEVAEVNQQFPRSLTAVHVLGDGNWRGMELVCWEMPGLYRSHDATIFTSAGEGYHIPPLESLACGVPIGHTGHFGFAPETPELKSPIFWNWEWRDITPKMVKCPYYHGSRWAEPIEDDVVEKLRFMVEHLDDLKASALIDAAWVRKNLTWERTANVIRKDVIEWSKNNDCKW